MEIKQHAAHSVRELHSFNFVLFLNMSNILHELMNILLSRTHFLIKNLEGKSFKNLVGYFIFRVASHLDSRRMLTVDFPFYKKSK